MRWSGGLAIAGAVLALLWLLFRSAAKPSRIAYPCQQASFGMAAAVFGAPLVAAVLALRPRALAVWRSTAGKLAAAALAVALAAALWPEAAPGLEERANLAPPDDYHPAVYVVNDARGPAAGRHGGIDDLIRLLGRNGLKWHRSAGASETAGPAGLIARDALVLIKINAQWAERGGTSTDVLRGVIRQIVEHPDGFTGEILVADNGQGSGKLNPSRSNAEDTAQSTLDVAGDFSGEGWRISTMLWDSQRFTAVEEFSRPDLRNGYVVNPLLDAETRIRVSYPKFRTPLGTYVSYKNGVWSEDEKTYDPERLVVINLPVLKTHSIYGVTASVKNHMGVVTRELGTDSHYAIGRGGLGSFLAEVRMPDISILDCTWILARPGSGPSASYGEASRRNQLAAGIDPVALDAWATQHILIPQIIANGYRPEQYRSTQDPENPDSVFRRYLDRTRNELIAAGIPSTSDHRAVRTHVWPEGTPVPFIRGDANQDGAFDISDPVAILLALFDAAILPCEDSADANDDGGIDISDPIFVLECLFLGGPSPPAPFPAPGDDPTFDALGCAGR